jgi:hypothetical protein
LNALFFTFSKHRKKKKMKKWREKKKIFSLHLKNEKARFQLFYHTRWLSKENSEKDNT